MRIIDSMGTLVVTIVASLFLIIASIVYFGVTLWVVKTASTVFFGTGLEANWAVFSAALMSVGAIVAGALEKKR